LYAVMQPTSSPVPPEQLAPKLLEHVALLTDAAESWLSKESGADIAERTLALREVAALLQVDATGIAEQAKRMRSTFGESFNAQVLNHLLACRSVPESARSAALAATRRASVKAPKSLNFIPVCEGAVLAQGGSVFHWAADQTWIEQASNLGADAVEDVGEDEEDLDLDAFLGNSADSEDDADDMDLDDFLDNEAQPEDDPAAERLRQARAAARKSRRSSAQRMATAAAAAAAATSVESPGGEKDGAESMRGFLHTFNAAELVEDALQTSVSNKLLAATRKAVNTAKGKLAAGWQQAHFVVKKNARLARVLTWYRQVGDRIPKGSLPIADIDEIKEVATGDAALPYEIVITCVPKRSAEDTPSAKPREVLLRTDKKEDRDAWCQALRKLMAREAARTPSKVNSQPSGSVLTLKDTLHLPDPDHHQCAPDEPQ